MMNLNFYTYMIILINLFLMMLMFLPSNLYKFHPLFMSLILVLYTIILVFKLNFFTHSYWYSYMLFLVMIGGLMILFMYFTSLMNNELIIFNFMYFVYLMLKILFFLFYFFLLMKFNNLNFLFNEFMEILNFKMMFNNLNLIFYKNLMMMFFLDMNLYMLFYLFLMMICSVIICLKTLIPLRQMKIN